VISGVGFYLALYLKIDAFAGSAIFFGGNLFSTGEVLLLDGRITVAVVGMVSSLSGSHRELHHTIFSIFVHIFFVTLPRNHTASER
jgi:hypothetical protein